MSEEIQQNSGKKCCKAALVISIIALLLSLLSLGGLTYLLTQGGVGEGGQKKVVISKQYDKGQSLQKALDTKKPVVVFFYTDWCHFCQNFVKTYAKIAKSKDVKKDFAVAYVNCEKPENQELMKEYEVQGFPTVYVINTDGKRTHLDNGTFFNNDSVEVIKKNMYEAIGQTKD